jgi:hypothetical protein
MTNEEAQNLDHGLYIIHWKEANGGGTSLASVGTDRAGRRWFAATNWIEVPSVEWSPVESMELIRSWPDRRPVASVESIQTEAAAEVAKYPAIDYVPHWHPYYWMGQRDAAQRLALEGK